MRGKWSLSKRICLVRLLTAMKPSISRNGAGAAALHAADQSLARLLWLFPRRQGCVMRLHCLVPLEYPMPYMHMHMGAWLPT